jgi:hypothetical protein
VAVGIEGVYVEVSLEIRHSTDTES